jgi:hypothetical protein
MVAVFIVVESGLKMAGAEFLVLRLRLLKSAGDGSVVIAIFKSNKAHDTLIPRGCAEVNSLAAPEPVWASINTSTGVYHCSFPLEDFDDM